MERAKLIISIINSIEQLVKNMRKLYINIRRSFRTRKNINI